MPVVALVALLALAMLLFFTRWEQVQAQAALRAEATLALLEAQSVEAAVAAVKPDTAILALSLCRGAQCQTLHARPSASACGGGTDLLAPCVSQPSQVHVGDVLQLRYDALPALQAAALDTGLATLLCGGVLGLAWRRMAARGGAGGVSGGTTAQQCKPAAEHDALTGLLTRVAFEAALKRHNEAVKTPATSTDGCLMYFDLDRFKIINDTHGHTAGDLVLKAVAGRLKYTLGSNVLIGRLGGDEFAVLLTDVSSQATIEQMGRVLIEQVSKPIQMGGLSDSVGLSIGAFMLTRGALSVGDMLHRADLAMYEAKRTGRNRLVFFEDSMETASRSRAQIQGDMKTAISERQFFMVYQPQVDRHDSIRGVESLVRWRHPTRGLIAPDDFISIAEQTGLIVPLGKLIIDLVCADLVALRAQRLALPYVSVNVSLRQLADAAFVGDVQEALKRHGLQPTDLEFEITESTAMVGQGGKENATLKKLSQLGFRLAIDDFGTGYSSLVRLLDLKVDKLKIDRVFVDAIGKPHFDPALLELMISLAKRLGVKSVAEGVENVEQVVWLRQAGCQMMQGYLYAKPMNHAQLISWLRLQEGDGDFDDGVWAPTQTMEAYLD